MAEAVNDESFGFNAADADQIIRMIGGTSSTGGVGGHT